MPVVAELTATFRGDTTQLDQAAAKAKSSVEGLARTNLPPVQIKGDSNPLLQTLKTSTSAVSAFAKTAASPIKLLGDSNPLMNTLKAAGSAVQAVGRGLAPIVLKADTKQAEEGTKRVHKGLIDLGGAANQAGGLLKTAFSFAGGGLLVGAVEKMFSFSSSAIIGANKGMAETKLQFTTLMGSAEAAGKEMAALKQITDNSPFGAAAFQASAKQLLGLGMSADKVNPLLHAIGETAFATGRGEEGIARLTKAMTVVSTHATLTTADILKVEKQGVPAWEMLAQKIGTDVPTAMAMVDKKLVSTETFLDAFKEGAETKFGGAMEKASQDASVSLERLGKAFSGIVATIFAPLYEKVGQIATKLLELARNPVFKQVAAQIAGVIGGALDQVTSKVEGFFGALFTAGGDRAGFFEKMGLDQAGAERAGALLDDVQLKVTGLFGALTSTGGDRAGFFAQMGFSEEDANHVGAIIDDIQLKIQGLIGVFQSTGGDRAGFLAQMGFSEEQANAIGALLDGIQLKVQGFFEAVQTFGSQTDSSFSGLGPVVQTVGDAFNALGTALSSILTADNVIAVLQGISGALDTIGGAVAAVRQAWADLDPQTQGAIGTFLAVTAGVSALVVVLPAVAAGIAGLAAAFTAATIAAGASAIAIAAAALPIVAIGAAAALLVVGWTQNWGDIQGKTATVAGFLSETFTNISSWITTIAIPAVQSFAAAVVEKWEQVQAITATIASAFQTTFAAIGTAVDAGIKSVQNFASAVDESVKNLSSAAGAALEAGRAVVQGFINGITEKLEAARQVVTNLGNLAKEAMQAALDQHSPSLAFEEIGKQTVAGFVQGVSGAQDAAAAAVTAVAEAAIAAADTAFQNSPSRRFQQMGEDIVQGLSKGIALSAPVAVATTMTFAEQLTNSATAGLTELQQRMRQYAIWLAQNLSAAGVAEADLSKMVAAGLGIAKWESGGFNERATRIVPGSESAYGLFQLDTTAGSVRASPSTLYDPQQNIALAVQHYLAPAYQHGARSASDIYFQNFNPGASRSQMMPILGENQLQMDAFIANLLATAQPAAAVPAMPTAMPEAPPWTPSGWDVRPQPTITPSALPAARMTPPAAAAAPAVQASKQVGAQMAAAVVEGFNEAKNVKQDWDKAWQSWLKKAHAAAIETSHRMFTTTAQAMAADWTTAYATAMNTIPAGTTISGRGVFSAISDQLAALPPETKRKIGGAAAALGEDAGVEFSRGMAHGIAIGNQGPTTFMEGEGLATAFHAAALLQFRRYAKANHPDMAAAMKEIAKGWGVSLEDGVKELHGSYLKPFEDALTKALAPGGVIDKLGAKLSETSTRLGNQIGKAITKGLDEAIANPEGVTTSRFASDTAKPGGAGRGAIGMGGPVGHSMTFLEMAQLVIDQMRAGNIYPAQWLWEKGWQMAPVAGEEDTVARILSLGLSAGGTVLDQQDVINQAFRSLITSGSLPPGPNLVAAHAFTAGRDTQSVQSTPTGVPLYTGQRAPQAQPVQINLVVDGRTLASVVQDVFTQQLRTVTT